MILFNACNFPMLSTHFAASAVQLCNHHAGQCHEFDFSMDVIYCKFANVS